MKGLHLVKKAVRSVSGLQELREGSTGRVVVMVPRIWAVAEPTLGDDGAVAEDGAPITVSPTRDDGTVMNGAPGSVTAPEVEVAFYRKYTEGMLRRYMQLSTQAGRVPSLLGRELFRGHVTSYKAHSFEDVAIFCFDVEKCLKVLDARERELVKRIALQQYSQAEAAMALGISLRHCAFQYRRTLDKLTRALLEAKLLEVVKCCQ